MQLEQNVKFSFFDMYLVLFNFLFLNYFLFCFTMSSCINDNVLHSLIMNTKKYIRKLKKAKPNIYTSHTIVRSDTHTPVHVSSIYMKN